LLERDGRAWRRIGEEDIDRHNGRSHVTAQPDKAVTA
jgi:hypothetical protein